MRKMGKAGFLEATTQGHSCIGTNGVAYGLLTGALEGIDLGYRDMHGGNGITDEFHVIRHILNIEAIKEKLMKAQRIFMP